MQVRIDTIIVRKPLVTLSRKFLRAMRSLPTTVTTIAPSTYVTQRTMCNHRELLEVDNTPCGSTVFLSLMIGVPLHAGHLASYTFPNANA